MPGTFMSISTARKIAEAFINEKKLTLGNYKSTESKLLLFGNTIAEKCKGGFVINDHGYCSATTAKVLNALPGVRLRRLKGKWVWNEERIWNGKEMFIEYNS